MFSIIFEYALLQRELVNFKVRMSNKRFHSSIISFLLFNFIDKLNISGKSIA